MSKKILNQLTNYSGFASRIMMAVLHGVKVDSSRILRELGENTFTTPPIIETALSLDLNTKLLKGNVSQLHRAPQTEEVQNRNGELLILAKVETKSIEFDLSDIDIVNTNENNPQNDLLNLNFAIGKQRNKGFRRVDFNKNNLAKRSIKIVKRFLLIYMFALLIAPISQAQTVNWAKEYVQAGLGYASNNQSESGTQNSNGTYAVQGDTYSAGFSSVSGFASQVGFGELVAISDYFLIGFGVDYVGLVHNATHISAIDHTSGNSLQTSANDKGNIDYYFTLGYALDELNLIYLKAGGGQIYFNQSIGAINNTLGGLGYRHKVEKDLYVYADATERIFKNGPDGDAGSLSGSSKSLIFGFGKLF